MDWMAQEQERGITITSAATTACWRDRSRSTSSIRPATWTSRSRWSARLRVLDGAVAVFDSVDGVSRSPRRSGARPTSTTCRGWRSSTRWTGWARTSSLPSQSMQRPPRRQRRCRCSSRSAPEDKFSGVVDLVGCRRSSTRTSSASSTRRARSPPSFDEQAQKYHAQLIERSPTSTTRCWRQYIEDETLGHRREIRRALREGDASPTRSCRCCCGSAYKNKGVQPLLDAVIDYLPSPARRAADQGHRIRRRRAEVERERRPTTSRSAALAFKIRSDPYVGKLTYFRVYSGTLEGRRSYVLNTTNGKTSASAASCTCTRTSARSVKEICAGDIAAARRPEERRRRRHALRPTSADRARVDALPGAGHLGRHRAEDRRPTRTSSASRSQRLAEEDPTFRVRTDDETGQTIISGMGELHLEIIVDRMKREFKVEANVGTPAGRLPRDDPQDGRGGGQVHPPDRRHAASTATCVINLEPAGAGQGLRVRRRDRRRRDPAASTSRPSKRASARRWRAACSPDIPSSTSRSTLFDGSYHDVDSSEMAFKIAGSMAFKEALQAGEADAAGAGHEVRGRRRRRTTWATSSATSIRRRAQVEGHEPARAMRRSSAAIVPLAEMFGYATDVRSLSQGRASFNMEPSHYEEVPRNVAEEIIEQGCGESGANSREVTERTRR